jgi:hypothetical protein
MVNFSALDRSLRALLLRYVDCVGPPWRPAVGALALAVVHLVLRMRKYDWSLPPTDGHFTGPLLVICFLSGLTLYLYKDRIVWSLEICVGAVIASFFMLWVGRYFDYFTL